MIPSNLIEGPVGVPQTEEGARALEAVLKATPGAEFTRAIASKAVEEVTASERSDISWIQTECIDRENEIVLTSGMRDDLYALNPIVTINHQYWIPPVGKSVWRTKARLDGRRGVRAKTIYPSRPDEWPAEDEWRPDSCWALVRAGLMTGKSIGFLPVKWRSPEEAEVRRRPELAQVRRIVEEWILLEYACCWLPANGEAVIEEVSKSGIGLKGLQSLGLQMPTPPEPPRKPEEGIIPFTTEEEMTRRVRAGINGLTRVEFVQEVAKSAWDVARGRV